MELAKVARRLVHPLGIDIVRYREVPEDFTRESAAIYQRVAPFTMTPPERIWAAEHAASFVVAAKVPGAIVECGTWQGGSLMAMALSLIAAGETERDLWGYDSFVGMTRPGQADLDLNGKPADLKWAQTRTGNDSSAWCDATEEEVRTNLVSTGYPAERVRLVAGKVEETIPDQMPDRIAVLRLDTDWYESTRHELRHLWPRLSPGGVLIVDDYGHWQGSRKAVDEYLAENKINLLLTRTDYSGRMAVKPR